MDTKNRELKINKLCNEYLHKVTCKSNDIKILLIDFTREYNKIWQE